MEAPAPSVSAVDLACSKKPSLFHSFQDRRCQPCHQATFRCRIGGERGPFDSRICLSLFVSLSLYHSLCLPEPPFPLILASSFIPSLPPSPLPLCFSPLASHFRPPPPSPPLSHIDVPTASTRPLPPFLAPFPPLAPLAHSPRLKTQGGGGEHRGVGQGQGPHARRGGHLLRPGTARALRATVGERRRESGGGGGGERSVGETEVGRGRERERQREESRLKERRACLFLTRPPPLSLLPPLFAHSPVFSPYIFFCFVRFPSLYVAV